MFCKHSAALLLLIGFAAAQTSPSDQCYNLIIGNLTQRSGDVSAKLGTLIQEATLGTVGKLVSLESEYHQKTQAYITKVTDEIEILRIRLRDCADIGCAAGVATDLGRLLNSVGPSLVSIFSDFLAELETELNSIANINVTNLGNTINSIDALRTYIATNSAAIRLCLNAEFPLLGLLG